MKYKFYPAYIDRWGQIWKHFSKCYVWNEDCGYGLWDNGNGLMELNNK